MPLFKWLGAALLLACGCFVGVCGVSFERRRLRQAEGFFAVFKLIRTRIESYTAPLGEIIGGLDRELLADCGAAAAVTDFIGLLEQTTLYLSAEMTRLLTRCAAELGEGGKEEQLRCCDYCIERLGPYCERLGRERPRRERSALLLPVILAAVVVLLLI